MPQLYSQVEVDLYTTIMHILSFTPTDIKASKPLHQHFDAYLSIMKDCTTSYELEAHFLAMIVYPSVEPLELEDPFLCCIVNTSQSFPCIFRISGVISPRKNAEENGRAWNNHVIASFFPFDHHHPHAPRNHSRSFRGQQCRGGTLALEGGSRSCGPFTSTRIPTPPTSDGFMTETRNHQQRVQQQEELQEKPQDFTRTVGKRKRPYSSIANAFRKHKLSD
ncbi:hypothetical protein K435DRAFT_849162 [Dendrothele bispora CBS 962.96]|uniref:Uncharacterized protein n=1 Tax=Dendrothele bispora (strain CBS 962.96) TaxID=1314807 RepID=A0A4S8MT73_DENBC|nr:hypothetical protein K435DRAFT_849162 [Dendrothele bispora CBS 962.96]